MVAHPSYVMDKVSKVPTPSDAAARLRAKTSKQTKGGDETHPGVAVGWLEILLHIG